MLLLLTFRETRNTKLVPAVTDLGFETRNWPGAPRTRSLRGDFLLRDLRASAVNALALDLSRNSKLETGLHPFRSAEGGLQINAGDSDDYPLEDAADGHRLAFVRRGPQ